MSVPTKLRVGNHAALPSGSTCYLENVQGGTCLDAQGGKAVGWSLKPDQTQFWVIEGEGPYTLRNVRDGGYLTPPNNRNATPITTTPTPHQWHVKQGSRPETFAFESVEFPTIMVCNSYGRKNNNNVVWMWKFHPNYHDMMSWYVRLAPGFESEIAGGGASVEEAKKVDEELKRREEIVAKKEEETQEERDAMREMEEQIKKREDEARVKTEELSHMEAEAAKMQQEAQQSQVAATDKQRELDEREKRLETMEAAAKQSSVSEDQESSDLARQLSQLKADKELLQKQLDEARANVETASAVNQPDTQSSKQADSSEDTLRQLREEKARLEQQLQAALGKRSHASSIETNGAKGMGCSICGEIHMGGLHGRAPALSEFRLLKRL